MNSNKNRIAVIATAATLAVGGYAASIALADEVKVTGGETELKLDKATAEGFNDMSIGIVGTTFEVVGGKYDFAPLEEGGGGVLKHEGKLKFVGEDAKLKLDELKIKIPPIVTGDDDEAGRAKSDSGVLLAKTKDGEKIEVGRLNTRNYESDEAMYTFAKLRVILSKEAAKALNATFETDVFQQGIKFGKLSNESEVGTTE